MTRTEDSQQLAREVRRQALIMVHRARASHIGSALSIVDILAVLYGRVMRVSPEDPASPLRDRFILSKGHACVALYALLAEIGTIPRSLLAEYGNDFSILMHHASHHVPGVELSTGSLGHGLPFGVGKALAAKMRGEEYRVFVLLSDGELDEGSNWEAFLFAAHHALHNLTVIVDYNNIQSLGSVESTIELEPLIDKFVAFNWQASAVDGHDHEALAAALAQRDAARPTVLVARTVKGRGVSFMENDVLWHYRNPSDEQLAQALAELSDP